MVGIRIRNLLDARDLRLDGIHCVLTLETLIPLDRRIFLCGCLCEVRKCFSLHLFLLNRIELDISGVLDELPNEISNFDFLRRVILCDKSTCFFYLARRFIHGDDVRDDLRFE